MSSVAPHKHFVSVNHALYQASMWRHYAMEWARDTWPPRRYIESVIGANYKECLRRSREAVEAARVLNQREANS